MALLSPRWRKASKWVHFQVNPSGCSDLSKSFGYHIKMLEITSFFSTLWTQPWVSDPVFGSWWVCEHAITAELSSSSGVRYPSRSVLVLSISQSHVKEIPNSECLLKNRSVIPVYVVSTAALLLGKQLDVRKDEASHLILGKLYPSLS